MPINPLPADLSIRPYREGDQSYLAATFLKSARNLALFAGTPDRLYYEPMQRLLNTFLHHPAARVAVVCESDDPDHIVAWVCAWLLDNSAVIWYAYTRAQRRREGICGHLIDTLPGASKAGVFTSQIWNRISQKRHIVRYPTLILEVSR